MKHLSTLFAFFLVVQLHGQGMNPSAQQLIRENAAYWAKPQAWNQLLHDRAGVLFTHSLDSVVSKDALSFTTQKIELIYNDLGHTLKANQYSIDSVSPVIHLTSVITFDYDDLPDYPSHMLVEGLNLETHQFEPSLEMDFTYDASHRVDSVVISLEDPLGLGGFGPFLATKQVYDGDLLVQSRQWFYFSIFGLWVPSTFTDFQYDANDRLTDQLVSVADFSTGEILPSTRTTYDYNAEGLQDRVTEYTWVDPNWEPTQQTTYSYYSNNTLSGEIRYQYSGGTWVNNLWTVYPIEQITDVDPVSSYIWDPLSSSWNQIDSTVSLLNPALPWNQVATPKEISLITYLGGGADAAFLDEEGSSIEETRYFSTDTLTGNLKYDSKDIYYYSLIEGSAVEDVLPEYLTITPNPATNGFVIYMDRDTKATYRIYNATGSLITRGEMQPGENTIRTDAWPTGVYYVSMRLANGSMYVHKQMVE